MVWHARLRIGLVGLLVLACVLPGVANGDGARRFGFEFGAPGEGAGELALVSPVPERLGKPNLAVGGSGVAVDQATRNVYVADTGNRRVDEFEADGLFMRSWGWGVADGAAKLESCGPDAFPPTVECRKGLSGGAPGEFAAPRFITVDNSGGSSEGDVYVGDGVGSEAQNEIQFVEFGGGTGGVTGGMFTLSYEGHTTTPIPYSPRSPHGEDVKDTVEALEAATGKHGVFYVKEEYNSNGEVIFLEVEFVGALKERVTGLLECIGTGLTPAGTKCEVLLDREGSTFAGEVVSKFSEEGALETSWGVGGQLDGSATPAGAFLGDLDGLTVDATGTLWVYDQSEMYAFEPGGGFGRDCAVGPGSASGLAPGVDPGEVYSVLISDLQRHAHLCEAGQTVQTLADYGSSSPAGLGSDSFGGVLVDNGGLVADLAPSVAEAVSFGPVPGGLGVGVNAEGGAFVASGPPDDKVEFFGVALEAETLSPGDVTATSATLNGEVDAKGTEVVSCVFQYGETESYGVRAPCEPSGPIVGSGGVKVHAVVEGLTPGTVYHYRLRVVNKSGEALDTNDEQLPTVAAGVVEESATVDVEPVSARLTARVNPKGVEGTKCRIEFGTSSAYVESAACEPSEGIKTGNAGVEVGLQLEGLSAGTTYHWRVVLSDEHDTKIAGPDNTFVYIAKTVPPVVEPCPESKEELRGESDMDPVTGRPLSGELPDCRAYEMVTPVQKNAAELAPVFDGPGTQIGAEGTRVIGPSLQCFAQSVSCGVVTGEFGVPFEFSRGEAGWAVATLAPAASMHEEDGQWGASAETGMVLFTAPVAGQVADTFYAGGSGGRFEAIGPMSEAVATEELRSLTTLATADLSHVIFWSGNKEGLWPSLIAKGEPMYEYAGRDNSKPFLVDVEGGEGSTKALGDCTTLATPGERSTGASRYAMSADGRIVYFEVCPGGEEGGALGGELYARVDGESEDARTVAVSLRARGGGTGPDECFGTCAASPASGTGLEGVSEDGSRVFFTSTQQLTNDASEDEGQDAARGCTGVTGVGGCNLYMYEGAQEEGGGHLVDVSAGDVSGLGPQVQGVMSVSADGSHVYFVAKGVLAGANSESKQPREGADNLYMYERDGSYPAGRTVFIATLPDSEAGREVEAVQWEGHGSKAANVTPDGDFLLFTSHGALTADDTRGLGPEQVYWYDALTGTLARASIGEHGLNDDGNAGTGGAGIVVPNTKVGQPRRDPSMSDDGSLVFFQSPVGLTARALNDVPMNAKGASIGVDQAQNVYEWEAPGTHGCGEASGCVYLISDGQDVSEEGGAAGVTGSAVELLGTDASGDDVFFTTADQLVPADTDSEIDYYDARVDGGFPAPSTVPGCDGENCHGAGPAPEIIGPLPSEVLTGEGNLLPQGASKPRGPPPPLTRSQKLAKALAGCRKDRVHRKRAACEEQARKHYGPVKPGHSSSRRNPKGRGLHRGAGR